MKSPRNPLEVAYRDVGALIPYARNSRTHNDAQVAQIAASIREFGFTNPVLLDEEDGIIAGHGRVLAARKLKMPTVPCIVIAGLSETQKRAYVIADNKLALNAGWDDEMLAMELGDLHLDGFDLSLTGFNETDLNFLLSGALGGGGLTDPDDIPSPPVSPVSALGDVWVLGNHRLVYGDCTDPLVVEKALAGVKPHLMVTDQPYGVEYDAIWRSKRIRSDGLASGGRADWREAWALFPGDVAYVWHDALSAGVVADTLTACQFNLRSQIIWSKGNFAISRSDYHWQHEPCWYAVRKASTGHWAGDRKQTTIWQIDKPVKSETGHSTQKPVECMKRPIENSSSPGQAVYEPFSGSGTTIIAAEMTGRVAHAIELNPAYVDVAVKRWQQFTGKTAFFESDGRSFDEIAMARPYSDQVAKQS